jgi:hypothetical protein
VLTVPILEGTDAKVDESGKVIGKKMSKSAGNYVGLREAPAEMYRKMLQIDDQVIWRYFELLSAQSRDAIAELRATEKNPMTVKGVFAKEMITRFHSAEDAEKAEAEFKRVYSGDAVPENVPVFEFSVDGAGLWLPKALADAQLVKSTSDGRRLVEQGVRFVQLFDWGWDFHGTSEKEDIRGGLTKKCGTMDQPVAALIKDLRQRGLLEDTLIVLGGEFGRTPFREGRTATGEILGRDHYPDCYTMVLAGGGIKGGLSYGETDELGFNITRDPLHVHDLQATLMNQLGFNHERLTYRFEGRDYRLTDVHGKVVKGILA